MPRHANARRTAALSVTLGRAGVLALCAWPGAAAAADRWEPVAGEATVTLPAPTAATGIAGAALRCAEQKWSLVLALAPDATAPGGEPAATLAAGGQVFTAVAGVVDGAVAVPVAALAIAPIKSGTAAKVTIEGTAPALEATFSLRGSKAAIEAAEPLCSKRDMSDYERIGLTPYSSYVLEAKALRADEIELFRKATTAQPKVAAAKSVMPDGRSLLFVELCGSAWYYGASGCNVAAFARTTDADAWTQVYDTEGADLYLDTKTLSDGWPTLIALPKTGGGDEIRWAWSDGAYAIADEPVLASGPAAPQADGEQ